MKLDSFTLDAFNLCMYVCRSTDLHIYTHMCACVCVFTVYVERVWNETTLVGFKALSHVLPEDIQENQENSQNSMSCDQDSNSGPLK
jgi:hypothetical protein